VSLLWVLPLPFLSLVVFLFPHGSSRTLVFCVVLGASLFFPVPVFYSVYYSWFFGFYIVLDFFLSVFMLPGFLNSHSSVNRKERKSSGASRLLPFFLFLPAFFVLP